MKRIEIKRDANDKVTFDPVSIDTSENVFFINLDPKQPHKPSILKLVGSEQLGPAPSPPSSQCPVPAPATGTTEVSYKCDVVGHETEKGIINVFPPLAAVAQTALATTIGTNFNQPLVVGGKPPYVISELVVNNKRIQSISTAPNQRLPIGNDFTLYQNNQGISVAGNPTQAATYNFTFWAFDSMDHNLQQVQFSIKVNTGPASPSAP